MNKNPLLDIFPPKQRKYVYALVSLASLLFGAWQASEGNFDVFIGSVFATLVTAMAASNTAPAEK